MSKKEHRMYRNMLAKKYDNCAVEEQINYFLFSECVLIIQSMYRKYLMRRWFNKYRLYYSKHLKEIIALQANVRKYFARKRYIKDLAQAVKYIVCIQRKFRMRRFIMSLTKRRKARVNLQRYVRKYVYQLRYHKRKMAGFVIQRLFKKIL